MKLFVTWFSTQLGTNMQNTVVDTVYGETEGLSRRETALRVIAIRHSLDPDLIHIAKMEPWR